ncbi:MAG: TolC family protein [Nitrospiria bacterium]
MAIALYLIFQAPFPSEAASPPLPLSLSDAVAIALENNVALMIERENIRLHASNIMFEDAQFDPALRLSISSEKNIRGTASSVETAFNTRKIILSTQRLGTGINQRLRWGGDLDLSLLQSRSSGTLQDLEQVLRGETILTLSQPLLQGFGRRIVQGPLRIAKTEAGISEADFRSKVSSLILDISHAYWDLVFQRKNLLVKQQSLQSARQLLDTNRAKVKLGLMAPIEILVAESGAASREEAVLIAKEELEDKEDELRLLLNLKEQSMSHPPTLLPTDAPIQTKKAFTTKKVLESALSHRPEIEENLLKLQNSELRLELAEDQLSPALDFVGKLGLNGLGGKYSDEVDQLRSMDFFRWEAGIVLRFPLGNRVAEARRQREKSERNKARLVQTQVIQEVILETKKALRQVMTGFKRIETAQRARHLSEKKLSAGQERFSLGLINSNDLLKFQDELADTRGKELKAVIDYNKSLTHLERVTGTLIEKFGIETLS